MSNAAVRHFQRLQLVCFGILASVAVYALIVAVLPWPAQPVLPQGEPLLWGFAFLAAVNLVTIMPVYRVMLAGPRRVFAVSQQSERLLAAHFVAHLTAFARLEAVALLGLVLFALTGRRDWFAIFTAVAALGMLVLWPRRAKIAALLEAAGQLPEVTTAPQ
ncbi:MAG TPA: hypothetical protein PLB88_02610 [Thermoanaerobaculaceae bacterium]|nr:hypothetical protein [Thermoanaerobaculaceae bacterium]